MADILIVDDDPSLLCVLSNLLKSAGYTVQATLRGDRALHSIKSHEEFDLLISDVRMNPIAGMDLLKLSKEARPELPVIIITAYYSQDKAKEAKDLGAYAFVAKPWDTDKLLDTIKQAIASSS